MRLFLDRPAPANCTVNYATVDRTAIAGTHYTSVSGTATFAEGTRFTDVSIPILTDETSFSDHRFQLLLSAPVNCVIGTFATNVIIQNSDTRPPTPEPLQPPSVDIENGRAEVPGTGTRTGYLTIATSRRLTEAITGTATTRAGTATANTNFAPFTRRAWTIPAGQSTTRIPVQIASTPITRNVSFQVSIAITSGNAVVGRGTATFTITVGAEPSTLRAIDLDLTGTSRGGTASVIVTRTGNPQALSFVANTLSRTARSGVEFTAVSNRTVRMSSGQTSAVVPVIIATPRSRVDASEFILRISNPSPSSVTIAKRDATVSLPAYTPTVVALPLITMDSAQATEPPAGGSPASLNFVISASRTSDQEINGSFRTSNISATAGRDYTAVNTTWRIRPGQRSTTVRVPVLGDLEEERNETLRATIGIDSGNARFAGGAANISTFGTITNRAVPVSVLNVQDASADRSGEPGVATARVRVTRTGDTSRRVTFLYDTESTGSASAPEDYDLVSNGRGTIQAGSSSTTINIRYYVPLAGRARETFRVRIHTPSAGARIGDGTATITLSSRAAQVPVTPGPISVQNVRHSMSGTIDVAVTVTVTVLMPNAEQVRWRLGLQLIGGRRRYTPWRTARVSNGQAIFRSTIHHTNAPVPRTVRNWTLDVSASSGSGATAAIQSAGFILWPSGRVESKPYEGAG